MSTRKQEAFLKGQVARLEDWARSQGRRSVTVAEVASGANEAPPVLAKVLEPVRKGRVEMVAVEYEHRLARFGTSYLRRRLEAFGVRLVVPREGQEEVRDLQRELAEDLVAIVASFAGRVYGKRGGRGRKDARETAQEGSKKEG